MKTLDQIALECGTDKASNVHGYTRHYETYFAPLRDKHLNVLEIGVQNGYSLKMWEEYFPNAMIYGMDINDCSHFLTRRTIPIQADQSDRAQLLLIHEWYGPFDVIIDDGSHKSSDMLLGFETLFPLLNPGGFYVVEDLHTCYWGEPPVFRDRLKTLIDEVNASGKSGVANRNNDTTDGTFIEKKYGEMTWWEQNVEFLHLYRSIVFIKRI